MRNAALILVIAAVLGACAGSYVAVDGGAHTSGVRVGHAAPR